MLKGFADTMLRSQREVDQLVALNGCPNTYMDPVLKNNPKKYALFVRRCHAIGILDFTLQCKSELGIFFVKKKHNKLRMILDCRATNLLSKTPPPTSLVTGEGLGEIEVDIGDARDESWASQLKLAFGVADVSDCFHRMVLNRGMSSCVGEGGWSKGGQRSEGWWRRTYLAYATNAGNGILVGHVFGPKLQLGKTRSQP